MKKRSIVIGGLLTALALVTPASAAVVWSEGANLPYSSATVDIEGQFNTDGDAWTGDSTFRVLDGTGSQVPAGWKFAQQDWCGSNWAVASSTNFTEGDAALKMTPGGGLYNDIFAGTFITGLTVGQMYTLTFDFQADAGFTADPGVATGQDHQTSASYNVMNVPDSPIGWGMTEDYPGHETGSTWIGVGNWDGSYHQQSRDFTASAASMAFVIKIRSMDAVGSVRIDNLVVTPEPASMLLLALGGLVCLRRRR